MAHEVGSGTFDFTGETHPRRDLVGFLDLLGEMDGLALVLHNVNGYEHAEIAALLGLHPNTV